MTEGFLSYLNETEILVTSKSNARTIEEFSDLNHLEKALATRAAHRLKELG